ncbi:hypothetical protein DRO69_06550 [Candidatus Bathyarchaeota archaeon]|nr:MAG: hypothetical protein DRO69_06550 [Candidatus Bathyarchaeota archaeon]
MSTTYLKGKQIIRGENAELRLTEESFDKVDVMAVGTAEREAVADQESVGTIRGHMLRVRARRNQKSLPRTGERRGDKTHRDYRLRPPPRLYPNPPTKGGG